MQVVKANMLTEQETQILECRKRSALGFLGIGQALSIINKNDLWRFSDSCTSFSNYVEKSQGMKKSMAYALIGVYERFSPILLAHEDLKAVEPSRLIRLLPYVNEDNVEELTHTAALLPAKAFDDQVRQLAGKVPQDTCDEHDWRIIKQCKICGLKVKQNGAENSPG